MTAWQQAIGLRPQSPDRRKDWARRSRPPSHSRTSSYSCGPASFCLSWIPEASIWIPISCGIGAGAVKAARPVLTKRKSNEGMTTETWTKLTKFLTTSRISRGDRLPHARANLRPHLHLPTVHPVHYIPPNITAVGVAVGSWGLSRSCGDTPEGAQPPAICR
jgi:hypothetical protein